MITFGVDMKAMPLGREGAAAAKAITAMTGSFRKHYRALEAAPNEERSLALAMGWAIRMCRTAEALVVLHRYHLGSEAAPLLRSLMEHAAKTRWLVDRKSEALAAVEFEHRKYQRVLLDSTKKGGWDIDSAGRELPESDLDMEKPPEQETFRSVEQLCECLGHPEWYAMYRLESSTSHASYLSAAVYHDEDKITEPGFGLQFEAQVRGTPLPVTAVWLLMGLGQLSELAQIPAAFEAILNQTQDALSNMAAPTST